MRFVAMAALMALVFEIQEDLQLSLTCKPPSFKVRRPLLSLQGACPLPDGVVVKVNLSRAAESVVGGELQPVYVGAGSGTSEIEGKRFGYDTVVDGPGKYNAQILLLDDMQDQLVAAEVKRKAGARRAWHFELLVWGDELIHQLPPKLAELHALIAETRELFKRFETACQSEQRWTAESKPLVAEGTKLQAKLDKHELKAFYPAAVNNLYYTLRNVVNNAPYYTFEDGTFTGAKDYHADGTKVKTYRGEEFNWDNLKRYVEESLTVGGREFCLWVVKDLRRTAGQLRPELVEAVKSQRTAAGVEVWQDRLQKATFSDLDALEAEIRGAKGANKEGDKR